VHYFDPHWPYSKHEPWIYTYAPGYKDNLKPFYSNNLPKVRREAGIEKGTDSLCSLVALYDSEINYVDRYVGKLLDFVRDKKNTMVILVADHGEGFLEHNTLDHGYQLYEESVRVPLIIQCSAIKPVKKFFNTPGSIIDIPPTILEWLNIKGYYAFQGISLLPVITGKVPDEINESQRMIVSELNRFGKNLISVRKGNWKYIRDVKFKKEELYDLASDPSESVNIAEKKPFVKNEMKKAVSKWLATTGKQKKEVTRTQLDAESVEKLKSLGYVE
jgi:arylsulfatase A-like enzyme